MLVGSAYAYCDQCSGQYCRIDFPVFHKSLHSVINLTIFEVVAINYALWAKENSEDIDVLDYPNWW